MNFMKQQMKLVGKKERQQGSLGGHISRERHVWQCLNSASQPSNASPLGFHPPPKNLCYDKCIRPVLEMKQNEAAQGIGVEWTLPLQIGAGGGGSVT